jgi:hypothetical protein
MRMINRHFGSLKRKWPGRLTAVYNLLALYCGPVRIPVDVNQIAGNCEKSVV